MVVDHGIPEREEGKMNLLDLIQKSIDERPAATKSALRLAWADGDQEAIDELVEAMYEMGGYENLPEE